MSRTMKLSEEPVLGDWKLVVESGSSKESVNVKVDKYGM